MKNNMSYEEAIQELKKLEKAQKKRKAESKQDDAYMRRILQKEVQDHKRELNYLLSLVHAHKEARKLYGKLQLHKSHYEG